MMKCFPCEKEPRDIADFHAVLGLLILRFSHDKGFEIFQFFFWVILDFQIIK